MNKSFDDVIGRILDHEGGFTLNPADRGNWTGGKIGSGKLKGTKYGISAMTYPNEDIANLTLAQAKFIYRRDFWDVLKADRFHDGTAFQLLDFAVNSGIPTAIKAFQRAIGVRVDGVFGPQSLAASAMFSEAAQIMLVLAERLEFMVNAGGWLTFSKGWVRRVAANLRWGVLDL